MAANPLLFDGTWTQRQTFEEAETFYQETVSGVKKTPKSTEKTNSSTSSKPSTLKSEIAQARQNIQKALKDDGGKSGADNSQILSRLQSLEAENKNLQTVSQDLRALVKKLESRIDALEKSSSSSSSSAPAPAPAAAAQQKKADSDDDFDDMFGSDSESSEDEEAAAKRKAALDAYNAKKSKKPALIAKSSLLLDVKPWDDETDMKALEECVRSIKMEGLVWGQGKLVPVGYGIRKLVIGCVIEDDKVSTDELEERITGFEDYVQSMDIAAFNKI